MRVKDKPALRLRVGLWLWLGLLLLAGCGQFIQVESELGGIGLRATGTDNLAVTSGSGRGNLAVEVENKSDEDISVDLVIDVIDGFHFEAGPEQRLSSNERQVSRAGVLLGPGETRTVFFSFLLDENADPGKYFITVAASVPATQDRVETQMELLVTYDASN